MYKRIRGVEPDISWTIFTCGSERDLNSGSPDFKSHDQTIQLRYLLKTFVTFINFFLDLWNWKSADAKIIFLMVSSLCILDCVVPLLGAKR